MSFKDTNPKDAIGAAKVPLSLLSPVAKAAWALAQFCGATKYGAWNWRKAGVRMTVYLDAIDRHRDGLLSGEWLDPTDGTPHLGNIMACCAIILDARAAGKLIDDRPPSVDMRPTYAEVEAGMAKLRQQYRDKNPRHYTIADTELPATGPTDEWRRTAFAKAEQRAAEAKAAERARVRQQVKGVIAPGFSRGDCCITCDHECNPKVSP